MARILHTSLHKPGLNDNWSNPSAGVFTPNLPGGVGLVQRLDTVFTAAEVPYLGTGGGSSGFLFTPNSGASYGINATGLSHSAWGTTALQTVYPGNDAGNGVGGVIVSDNGGGFGSHSYSKMYMASAVYFPTDYSMHSLSEKFFYGSVRSPNSPSDVLTAVQWHVQWDSSPNGLYYNLLMTPNQVYTDSGHPQYATYTNLSQWGGTYVHIAPEDTTTKFTKGVEQHLECYWEMNTTDTANGVFKLWVNGTLLINRTNVRYIMDGSQGVFSGLRLDGTRGGGASDTLTPPGGQSWYHDRLAFWAI